MVTRKQQQPAWRPPAKTDDGQLQCTAAAGCTRVAVVQTTVTCHGCDDARQETLQSIDRKRAELDQHERQETAIRDGVRTEERELADAERAVLAVIAHARQQVGSDLERLQAAAAAVIDEHTHPVFACDKHAAK